MTRLLRQILPVASALLLSVVAVLPQSGDLAKADGRARRAAEIVTTFSTVLGTDSIPGKLLKRAKAVAILDVELTDGLLDKEIRGHGVLAFNDAGGWSVPTFVECKGIRMEWGRSIFRPKQRVQVVFLFMDDRSFGLIHGWVNKGPEIRGKQLALGPIVGGKGADDVESTASVIYYSFEGQKASGEEFYNTSFGSALRISHADDLNKKVFRLKFDEIRSSAPNPVAVPESLRAVQKILNDVFAKVAK